MPRQREVPLAWYLVPLSLGFIGGLIAYLIVQQQDQDEAEALFLTGIISSVFIFLFWLWIF